MNELINFYNTLEVDWVILGFMMLVSVFIAIFHTLIIGGLWNITFKPKSLFFFLNPSLIALGGVFDTRMGAFIFGGLFISVFIFGISGIIIASTREARKDTKKRIKNGEKPIPWWKKIIISLLGIGVFSFVFSLSPSYLIILIFVVIPFLTFLKKTNKKTFYKLQRDLPTASVRSVAMGLAEISGKTKVIEPVISRLEKKECIGYLYTRENVTKNDNGYSYTLEFSQTICNPFYIEDNTGKIKVLPKEIEFIDFEIDEQYKSSMKRYTQYILKENMEVLLIGKAGITKNNTPVFQKEKIKNIFGIAPIEKVNNHNDIRPFLQSAGYFIYLWVILIAIILLTPIHLKNNIIEFGKINLKIPFQKSQPVNSIENFNDTFNGHYEKESEEDIIDSALD